MPPTLELVEIEKAMVSIIVNRTCCILLTFGKIKVGSRKDELLRPLIAKGKEETNKMNSLAV